MDETASAQPTITPGQVDGEALAWNDETDRCADCGTTVEPEQGYKLYAGGEPTILCASCYQRRVAADSGGSTHDLTAEVDGGSG
jgi:recombinational DNA repair protein (RecF pathway)